MFQNIQEDEFMSFSPSAPDAVSPPVTESRILTQNTIYPLNISEMQLYFLWMLMPLKINAAINIVYFYSFNPKAFF